MKKINISINIITLIILTVILLIIPTEKTNTVLISYVFTALILLFNVYVSLKSKKLEIVNLSFIYLSLIFALAQTLILIISIIFPKIETWIIILLNIIVFVTAILTIQATSKSLDYISKTDEHINNKKFFIKEIEYELNILISNEVNLEIKNKMERIAEQIRFSDPISNTYTETVEQEIKSLISKLGSTSEDKSILLNTLEKKLYERNQKINLYK